MSKNFNLTRFNNLIIRHLVYNLKSIILFFSVYGIIMFILFFLKSLYNKEINYDSQFSTFFFWYVLIGLYFASKSFSETHNLERAYQYLTLPVSNFEKLLSLLLYSIFLYLTSGIVLFLIIGFLANIFAANIGNFAFNFLDIEPIKFIKIFYDNLLPFSIFIAGSITFRKHSFLKTVLSILIYLLILVVITTLIYKISLRSYNFKVFLNDNNFNFYFLDFQHRYKFVSNLLSLMFTFLIWLFTYFKLKEKEI